LAISFPVICPQFSENTPASKAGDSWIAILLSAKVSAKTANAHFVQRVLRPAPPPEGRARIVRSSRGNTRRRLVADDRGDKVA
jgi:hypothetical protein